MDYLKNHKRVLHDLDWILAPEDQPEITAFLSTRSHREVYREPKEQKKPFLLLLHHKDNKEHMSRIVLFVPTTLQYGDVLND